jgi:hypothetical protein
MKWDEYIGQQAMKDYEKDELIEKSFIKNLSGKEI